MSLFTAIRTFFTRLPKLFLWVGGFVIVIGAVIGIHHLITPSTPESASSATNLSHITVASVASLSLATSSVPLVGTVTSHSSATVLAQVPGEVVSLPGSLGDSVTQGQIIAEFSNSAQKAVVLQAQGAYEAAQAGLKSAQGTSVTGVKITVRQAKQGVHNAQTALSNALQSMYVALDDAVHAKADQLFSNPRTSLVRITFTVPDSRLVLLVQQERLKLNTTFTTILPGKNNEATSTLDARSTAMIVAGNSVIQFLGNLATAVNETSSSKGAPATTLAGYTVALGAARAEVSSALSGLIMAKSSYDNARMSMQAAENVATNGTPDAIALARARVTQARGAVGVAHSALEKTIIRSPINGIIVTLPIMLGDYVPMFSPVAIISNPYTLYVKTFVTSQEARALSIGEHATINNVTPGAVTFIAPTLNPRTNKREIKISILNTAHSLTDGEAVSITFNHPLSATAQTADHALSVPLTAIKITPNGPRVFTVNSKNILVGHKIIIKNITGSSVRLLSGVTPDMRIVLDARGLSNGQTVAITNK